MNAILDAHIRIFGKVQHSQIQITNENAMEIEALYLNASFFSVNNIVDVYILKTYLNMFIF